MAYFYENTDSEAKYFVALNTLTDVLHLGDLQPGNNLGTGQPITLFADTAQELADTIFNNQFEDDSSVLGISGDLVPVYWSIGYDEAGAAEVINALNSFDFLNATAVKHPTEDNYAVPFQENVFDLFEDGATKLFLAGKAIDSIESGNRRTSEEMISEGWVQ